MSSEHPKPKLILSELRKYLDDNFDKLVEARAKYIVEQAIQRLMRILQHKQFSSLHNSNIERSFMPSIQAGSIEESESI